jgi:hypothetical protein
VYSYTIFASWWGNWQWEVERARYSSNDVDNTDFVLEFGRGGWQDAHGGAVSHNYFFIQNVMQELDYPGEWYVDKKERKLYFWPLPEQKNTMTEWEFVVTQLPVIVQIGSAGRRPGDRNRTPVRNVRIEGITFAHSTTSFLVERYTVPSAGEFAFG